MIKDLHVVVLAAGKGSRMQSPLPKPMLPVGGMPMLGHVLNAAAGLDPNTTRIVIGPDMGITSRYAAPIPCVVQQHRLGTGHAVQVALENMIEKDGTVLVLNGDVPLMTTESLNNLVKVHGQQNAAVSVLGFETEQPGAYGRMMIENDNLLRIVEAKDASDVELQVRLCNGGIYAIDMPAARELLPQLSSTNAASEYYLTDIVNLAVCAHLKCAYVLADITELSGANTLVELAALDQKFQYKNIGAPKLRAVA